VLKGSDVLLSDASFLLIRGVWVGGGRTPTAAKLHRDHHWIEEVNIEEPIAQ